MADAVCHGQPSDGGLALDRWAGLLPLDFGSVGQGDGVNVGFPSGLGHAEKEEPFGLGGRLALA